MSKRSMRFGECKTASNSSNKNNGNRFSKKRIVENESSLYNV